MSTEPIPATASGGAASGHSTRTSNRPSWLRALFPFLSWFPMTAQTLRADLLAGITVSLILVPQSMAYAQLAGLPVIYGLYAALTPVVVASLWGSLRQLHTGPTAMLSLMSAAAVVPFAAPGSPDFISISIMLALMVGVLRLLLGLFRLGLIINLLSHPVTIGFTSAAALIIGLSQVNKIINVPMPRSDFFLGDVKAVFEQLPNTHWPTVAFAVGAFLLIYGLQKILPRVPAVLVAIIIATAVSYAIGFDKPAKSSISAIDSAEIQADIVKLRDLGERIKQVRAARAEHQHGLSASSEHGEGEAAFRRLELEAAIKHDQVLLRMLESQQARLRDRLNRIYFKRAQTPEGPRFEREAHNAPESGGDDTRWRFNGLDGDLVKFTAGGEVVGKVPPGLPKFKAPALKWDLMLSLFASALVMALIGFMEATSISTAIAAKTKQRVNANKELVGQGLGNIVGSFFQSYTVSGSFSRSAVAAREGAKTGLTAIISAVGVLLVVLFMTPLLYHLPQAVLAVIIMIAVFGLIRFKALVRAWHIDKADATIGLITFVATLAMAPALANGILAGVGLTILLYLIRKMRPRIEILGRHPDGTLGGMDTHRLPPISESYIVIRFDGSLSFVNVSSFETRVLQAVARFPRAKAVLLIASGINTIDVSGIEKIMALSKQLEEAGVEFWLSSLKSQVRRVFDAEPVREWLSAHTVFKTKEHALAALEQRFGGAESVRSRTEARESLGDASPASSAEAERIT